MTWIANSAKAEDGSAQPRETPRALSESIRDVRCWWVTLVLCAPLLAQRTADFHVGVSLVHVDAEVTDASGRIIDHLTKDDFRVLDEGKPQKIVQYSEGEEPLDLILLFDVSGSMRPKVADVADAAREGLQELHPGDRVCVMVFNTRSRVLEPFTEDLDAVERTVHDDLMREAFEGGTFIQSAVDDAALKLMHQPRTNRRRAVLIVTDNLGQRTRRESTVVRDFWEADATLSALIVRDSGAQALRTVGVIMSPQLLALLVGVKGITEKTGGDFLHSADPAQAFQDAMHRIRVRYSLYYDLPMAKPGQRRSIRVELTSQAQKRYPKAHVRARTGYFVPETGDAGDVDSPTLPVRKGHKPASPDR
jgi:Ca-activated chloride channel homolog